jgi:hypothetical protein
MLAGLSQAIGVCGIQGTEMANSCVVLLQLSIAS